MITKRTRRYTIKQRFIYRINMKEKEKIENERR